MSAGRKLNVLFAREHTSPETWPATVSCLLKPLGIATFEAFSGPDALKLARLHSMHLMVVDTNLPYRPEITLWRLIQQLQHGRRDDAASPHTHECGVPADGPPVILLSGQRNDVLLRDALRCNVFSVLPQPTDWQTLLDAMARALNRYTRGRWPDEAPDMGGPESRN